MDAVPVLSQIKSYFQWATGNRKGARETQKNFLMQCPVVSQGTSLVQAICGDEKGARETQIQFLKGVNGMVDSVPVVGHVKGAVHYICGDKEGGDNAMKAASHTTGVIGGGLGGFMVGGPVLAFVGGSYGGILMDIIISVSGAVVDRPNAKPYGIVDTVSRIVNDPTDGGNYVDLIGATVLDGMTGYTVGKGIGEKIEYNLDKRKLAKAVGKEVATDIVDLGESMRTIHSDIPGESDIPHVTTRAKDLVTGTTADGHNRQMRKVLNNYEYMTDGPTELQKRVPDAKQALGRPVDTCAEQQAYNAIYTERPDASPGDLRSVSVKWDPELEGPVTVKRCSNCQQFRDAMGAVPTDSIPETPVPKRVRFRQAATATAIGVSFHALTKEY